MTEGERIIAISPVMVARLSPLLEAIGLALAAGIEVSEQGLRTTLLAAGYDLSPEVLYEVLPELLHWSDLLRALRWQPSAPLRDATLEALTHRGLRPAQVDRVLDLVIAVGGGTDRNRIVEDVPLSPRPSLQATPHTLTQLPAPRKNVGGAPSLVGKNATAGHSSFRPRVGATRPSLGKKVRRPRPPVGPNVLGVRPHRSFSSEPAFLQYGLPLIVLFGLILRVWLATTQSAWNDEAWSLQKMAKIPLSALYNEVKYNDTKSPLYYGVLHLWVDFTGFGVFQARLLSVVFGVAAIPVLYFLTELLFDKMTALCAAFLLAISPVSIWFSDEIRMYAPAGLFALVAVYLLLRAARGRQAGWWIGYALCTALSCTFDQSGLYLPLAANLFYVVLLTRREAPFWSWLAANALALLLALPTLLLLRFQMVDHPGEISWIPAPTVSLVWSAVRDMFSLYGVTFWVELMLLVLCLLCVWGYLHDRQDSRIRQIYILLASLTIIPFAVPLAVSVLHPVFLMRTSQTATYGLLILFARGIVLLLRARISLGILLLLALIGLNADSLHAFATSTLKEDWRGLAQYVNRQVSADSLVLLDPGWLNEPYDLYWQSYHNRIVVHDDPPISSEKIASTVFTGFYSVWVVVEGTTDNPPADASTAYLQAHFLRVSTTRFVGITLFHYVAAGSVKGGAPVVLSARIHVTPDHVKDGSSLTVTIATFEGAVCTVKIIYDTDHGAVGWFGAAQPADDQGGVAWLVQVVTKANAGTASISCTLGRHIATAKARLLVTH